MPAPGASAPRQSSTRSSASSNGCWSQTAFAPISRRRSSTSTTASQLGRALALARQAQRARPSIDGDDVLSWALARNGRCAEALPYSRRALRLGTLDALKFFHRGMIERCLGHDSDARGWFERALRLNPQFSLLWSPVAREVRVVKRLLLLLAARRSARRPGRGGGAPARQLHGQPLQRGRALRRPGLRQVRAGHGRDPDLPGAPADHRRAKVRDRPHRPDRPRPSAKRRRPGRRADAGRARARLPARDGRPAHAALRSRLRIASSRRRPIAARVHRHELPRPDRLAGGRPAGGPWRTGLLLDRAVEQRQPGASRVPEGPPEQPPGGDRSAGDHRARRRRRPTAGAPLARPALHTRRRSRSRGRRLREPDRPGGPRIRRDPALTRDRPLLGRGARALARATERRSSPPISSASAERPSTRRPSD